MNFWAIFLTGLTTGGLSCLAMQGGLLASVIANQKEDEIEESTKKNLTVASFDQLDWLPVSLFLITKIIAHTFLGFALGWLGSRIELNLTMRLAFQGIAAFFMLATAANLLDLHPIFRYVVFQPPKFIQKMVRNSSKSKALFTPAILGFMTIFIPCGVTQAMEVLAITSGSPVLGALILFFFVLGTSPVFALVGVETEKKKKKYKENFLKIAAVTLVFLGLSSINGILTVIDAPITFGKATQVVQGILPKDAKENSSSVGEVNGVQQVVIQVKSNGYVPNRIQVKAGSPVRLTLQTKDTYTCASWFVMKAFNIKMQLGPNDTQTATFTPTQKGSYPFSCAMGMYSGVLEVM